MQQSAESTSAGWLPFDIQPLAHTAARVVELAGIAIIVAGILVAFVLFARRLAASRPFNETYHHLRSNLGRSILLGLELLVAADIIGTVAVAPTFYNLGVLALIVVIRTFLSFALEVEIDGKWPWQGDKHSRKDVL